MGGVYHLIWLPSDPYPWYAKLESLKDEMEEEISVSKETHYPSHHAHARSIIPWARMIRSLQSARGDHREVPLARSPAFLDQLDSRLASLDQRRHSPVKGRVIEIGLLSELLL